MKSLVVVTLISLLTLGCAGIGGGSHPLKEGDLVSFYSFDSANTLKGSCDDYKKGLASSVHLVLEVKGDWLLVKQSGERKKEWVPFWLNTANKDTFTICPK